MDTIDLKGAYLIVTYIDKVKNDTRLHNSVLVKDFKDDFVATYIRDVSLGSKRKISFSPQIENKFWKDKINKIIILNHYQINDSFITTLMYDIAIDSTDIFLKQSKRDGDIDKNTALVDALIAETFPDIQLLVNSQKIELSHSYIARNKFESLPLLFNSSLSGFSSPEYDNMNSFLLLRPQKMSNEKIYSSRENIIKFLSEFETYRNTDFANLDSVYIPYYTPEYIEAYYSNFLFGNEYTRILIGNSYPTAKTGEYVESGVNKLIELGIWSNLIKSTNNKIESEPIYKESIQGFTKSIIDKENSLQIIKEYNKENHLRIINDLYNFELLLLQFNSLIESSEIYFPKKSGSVFELREFLKGKESEFYSWSFLTRNKNERIEIRDKLEMLMGHLRKRSSTISEILNTFYLMHSTDVNIELQKRIKRITWIAIIIAFLSIITTIFATELHKIFVKLFP